MTLPHAFIQAFNTPNRSLKLQHAQRVVDPAEAAGAVGRVRCQCIDGGDLAAESSKWKMAAFSAMRA